MQYQISDNGLSNIEYLIIVYVMMDIVIVHHPIIQVILSKHLKWETSALMLTNVVLKMEVVNTIVKIQKGLSGN